MVREQAGRVLGANLRALREKAGMSLSELARRSNIAKGTLSQLESGNGNPTIETVFSLSNALGVPVSSLLTERADPDVLLVRSAGLEVLSSNAVDLRMLRRMDVTERVFELYDQRVRPGEVQHSAGHPGREHVVVTSGVLRVGPPDAPYELGPGDYVCFPAQGPHIYQTVGGPVVSVLLLEYPADAGPPRLGASCAATGADEGAESRG
ncbi:Transcriptional regulator, contains XRE-family HTH domain [Amycolatopsis arida]|uniref:Transcriptional regulator, contains XRE-family HTH domain n=1 Tax=Amycolatopsis arida TaxID=587909 RepID=A0A1I5MDG8_9PSEU|nr:XRE family transcriptional regulator [Amycolatopsis arida]TDX94041.1 transcriptional regulator with XRE-family HTH domain [Amycolatopsis arida]SFP07001.1 Transcriptional regulator, contains XRE-family HTH domain [Amycolatopsis arida]